jgi:hypothetical protein
MFTRRKQVIFLTVFALVLSSLACSLVSPAAAPPTPTPISTADYQAMETQVRSAAATAAAGGKVHLEFTEGQLTAAANEELQKSGETRIKSVQIGLNAGLLTLSGTVNQDGFEMPLTISMKITVDQQGKPHAQIVSGKVGMFDIPDSMLRQITDQVDQMIASQLQANGSNLYVESLTIDNGKIDVVAQMK